MKKSLFLFCCFLFTTSCHAQNISKTILIDGLQRNYILHLPTAYSTTQKLPLIFALHGGGGTAKGAVGLYDLESLADKYNCLIVYPDAINKAWHIPGMTSRVKKIDSSINDVRFISVLLDTMIVHYKADGKKVFCTGLSRSAIFSYYLADVLNERIAAVACVCGSISQTMAAAYSFKKPIPVLMINGTADPLINYNGGPVKILGYAGNNVGESSSLLPVEALLRKIIALNKCNATPVVTALPDVDKSDDCTETEYGYNCSNIKVDFIKIENGGHTWAGSTQYLPKFIIGRVCKDFSASQKIFDFFLHQ